MNLAELEAKTREELMDVAKELGITGHTALRKQDLIFRILQAHAEQQGNLLAGGILEIVDDGYGFLRGDGLLPGAGDVYVSQSQIRRFGLRTGDYVTGQVRPPKDSEKYYGLLRVEAVNGLDPEVAKSRPHFEHLTPIFPNKLINLETKPQAPHDPPDEPRGPHRARPARPDRLAAQGGQDDAPQEHRQRPSSPTTTISTSWSCSSASGRRRSPTGGAR